MYLGTWQPGYFGTRGHGAVDKPSRPAFWAGAPLLPTRPCSLANVVSIVSISTFHCLSQRGTSTVQTVACYESDTKIILYGGSQS